MHKYVKHSSFSEDKDKHTDTSIIIIIIIVHLIKSTPELQAELRMRWDSKGMTKGKVESQFSTNKVIIWNANELPYVDDADVYMFVLWGSRLDDFLCG